MRKMFIFFFLGIFIFTIASCDNPAGSAPVRYNSPQSDTIHIGVVYPVALEDEDTYFREGIDLAINSINANGGVLGKKLDIVVRDDLDDAHVAMQIAESFNDHGITAVVGHWSTNICFFVKDVYEQNKVVMITPEATGTSLFEDDYQYIYRVIANNQVFAEAISGYMRDEGFDRVAIYYSDDQYGADFSSVIEKELSKNGIDVIDRISSITTSNIKTVMNRWNAFGCDGVVMAALPPGIVETIKLIHDSDSGLPIFGADNFDRISFFNTRARYTDSLYMAAYQTKELAPSFWYDFQNTYGHAPDIHAISGYESVYLIKNAMDAAGTVNGTAIAEYLSSLNGYATISGVHSYNPLTQEFDGFNVAVRKFGE